MFLIVVSFLSDWMTYNVFMQVFRTLVENTKGIKGAKVENHKFCASVHYRNVDEKVGECFGLHIVYISLAGCILSVSLSL